MRDSGDDLLGDFDQEEAPARARKRPRRKGRIVLGVLVVLVLAVVGLVAGYGLMLNNTMNQAESVSEAFPDDADRPATVEPDDGYEAPVNILLLGTDTRASGASLLTDLGSRADTIMLMHIPGDRESVQLMSFMRDLWVDIPGHGTA